MAEPLTDLIQLYRIEQAALIAHQQEVERRRSAVRAAAEREASEIVSTARRNIRGTLLRARQELFTLTAQVRAAGCESGSREPGEPDDFHLPAARDVHTLLRDARSELADLSKEPPGVTLSAAPHFDPSRLDPPHHESGGVAGHWREQAAATAARLVEPFAAHWRIALVAAVIVAVVATMFVALRVPSRTEAAQTSRLDSARSVTKESDSKAAATEQAALNPTATRGSDVPPLTPASAGGVAAGTKPNAPAAATVAKGTPVQTPTPPKPAATAASSDRGATAEREILERHQRWFDAFDRGDRAAMASLASDNFSLADERPERAPAGSGRVEQTIRDVRVRVTGVGAVLSGQIAETATTGDLVPVAMLSEVWIRREDKWQLVSVRMVPVDAVPRALQ